MDNGTNMDRDVLQRLAALLLFMAVLAWRTSGERAAVRTQRLFFLSQAEARVMSFVAGIDQDEGRRLAALATISRPCDATEALRLSLSLRLLALIVLNIAAQIDYPPQPILRIRSGAGDDGCRSAITSGRGSSIEPPRLDSS